ncbi:MAG: hypothetical protein HYV32_05865 [Candidatus Kerfeldbacteria bacterium]|nr:hypothetical protein [Candidatus Kerfeldbacteria bacterium]
MIYSKDLQTIGFSKNQAKVYLALFNLGQAKASALIEATALHRNLVYTALQSLVTKKLITTTTIRGVAYFKMLDPERILNEIKMKETVAQQFVEELRAQRKPHAQEIVVYEGIDEVRRKELESYTNMKKEGSMYYLGASPHWHEAMGEQLIRQMTRIQREKQITIYGIVSTKTPELDYFMHNRKLTHIQYIPHITSAISETQILADRIMIKTFLPPYAVVEIINPDIAKNYRDYFDFMWKGAKNTVEHDITTA